MGSLQTTKCDVLKLKSFAKSLSIFNFGESRSVNSQLLTPQAFEHDYVEMALKEERMLR